MLLHIHQKLGTAGFVIAILALIAALSGTAVALTGAEKKQITKESKKFSKQFSKQFAKPGPKGEQGSPGAAGLAGAAGKDGAAGTDGKTPEITKFGGSKLGCTEGGVEVKLAPTEVAACNGVKGEAWSVGGTLPSGKTMTGAWGVSIVPKEETEPGVFVPTQGFSPISFFLPLTAAPAGVLVGTTALEKEEGEAEGCPGLVNGVPTANAGKLCVYMASKNNITKDEFAFFGATSPGFGVDKTGTILLGVCQAGLCQSRGSWAVTAP